MIWEKHLNFLIRKAKGRLHVVAGWTGIILRSLIFGDLKNHMNVVVELRVKAIHGINLLSEKAAKSTF